MQHMQAKSFDIVVFGATSFVGQILARYLLERFGLDGSVRWAAAGRSTAKLAALRAELGPGAAALQLLQADAADDTALRELCGRTRIVISTVAVWRGVSSPSPNGTMNMA